MNNANRRSIRLPAFDYTHPGAYFVTICVDQKKSRLGSIADGQMQLNQLGQITKGSWSWLEEKYAAIKIEINCVMPNHLHAILTITDSRRGEVSSPALLETSGGETPPLRPPPTLGQIVAAYKYRTTKAINNHLRTPGARFWQRNYYERVIRDEQEYESIWNYIDTNPQNWHADEENENRRGEVASPPWKDSAGGETPPLRKAIK